MSIYKTKACSNPFEIEREMHKHFEKYRICGEWFSCDMGSAISLLKKLFAENAKFNIKDYDENPLNYFMENTNREIKSKKECERELENLVEFMVKVSKEKDRQIERLISIARNLQAEIRIKNEQLERYEYPEDFRRSG